MSFPTKAEQIEKNPFWRRFIAALCVFVGLAGLGGSSYQRSHFNSQIAQLVADDEKLVKDNDKLVTSTSNLVGTTNTMVTDFGILMPQVTTLDARVAELDVKIAAAKQNHDAPLVAKLEAKEDAARKQADETAKKLLLSMAPSLIDSLEQSQQSWEWDEHNRYLFYYRDLERARWDKKSKEEIQKIQDAWTEQKAEISDRHRSQMRDALVNANYLRERMARTLTETEKDKAATAMFEKILKGDFDQRDLNQVTFYLRDLAKRLAGTQPTS